MTTGKGAQCVAVGSIELCTLWAVDTGTGTDEGLVERCTVWAALSAPTGVVFVPELVSGTGTRLGSLWASWPLYTLVSAVRAGDSVS